MITSADSRMPTCGVKEETGYDFAVKGARMKRLRRWLFNFAAAVSLGLCILLLTAFAGAFSFEKSISWPFGHYGPHRFTIQFEPEDLILRHHSGLNSMEL